MRDRPVRRTPLPRACVRLLVAGLAVAAMVLGGGYVLERVRLGRSDRDAFSHVEREVRDRVERITASLHTVARALASDPSRVRAARDDETATRELFDAVDAAIALTADPDVAATVYGLNGRPLAWAGRPSELPIDRLADTDTVFVAPGPLGLRLVALEAITDSGAAGQRRVGSVATERLLSLRRGVGSATADSFTFATAIAPVALRARYEGAGERSGPYSFVITGAGGQVLLEARVSEDDLVQARRTWRATVTTVAVWVAALTLVLLTGPLLDLRARSRTATGYLATTSSIVGLLASARLLLLAVTAASPLAGAASDGTVFVSRVFACALRSPADVLLNGMLGLALVALANETVERWRVALRPTRRWVRPLRRSLWLLMPMELVAGAVVVGVLLAYQALLGATASGTDFDVLNFAAQPLEPRRLSIAVGLLFHHAAVLWGVTLVLRLALARWRFRRADPVSVLVLVALWSVPVLMVFLLGRAWEWPVPWRSTFVAVGVAAAAAILAPRGVARFRHASQAARLILLFLALVIPAFVMYPSLVHFAERSARDTVETKLAPEAVDQREVLQVRLRRSLEQIDAIPALAERIAAAPPPAPGGAPSPDSAFLVWAQTDLAAYRLASTVELYSADGTLVSRFALNLPEYTQNPQKWQEDSCGWQFFEEVSPIGSVERRLLHAGRNVCVGGPGHERVAGTIVVHVIPDFDALPFISSQNPYFELMRTPEAARPTGLRGRDLAFVVYGWSRMPIYASGVAPWPLDDALFAPVYASRSPFWTTVSSGGRRFDVYLQNDRFGIYALGFPEFSLTDHLVNLAELVTLAGLTYVAWLTLFGVGSWLSGRQSASGRALLREIRASFYRKLFLAVVAAALIPVLTLAVVTRAFVAARLQAEFESAALRTTAVAQRVIEESGTMQLGGPLDAGSVQVTGPRPPGAFDDDRLVWISRVIGQDVNIFSGARLVATSKRDLFAPGLLPTRTPADVYRKIVLERLDNVLTEERAEDFSYMLGAAPVGTGEQKAILTVPLTLRQQAIRRELHDLTRRLQLATLVFILIGAALGYTMAERIADPVNRLTRATRRIAKGDLDARIAATSSDELRRLVEAFNSMADDLSRQRAQLERTHRLEAWAEMARQVAHEIKNPLTPIQLSAEHLRRVHADRGRPLDPVLDECVESILSQVRLLRQIAGEFSSFASSPTPRPELTTLAELVEEVVLPYRAGTAGRIAMTVEVPRDLPRVPIDRTLVGRALTNVIENALHAMPGIGSLVIRGSLDAVARRVRVEIADTGVGMDEEARSRVFEPYFSTKATGTGLGLTIAKRNVELNGGTISVDSRPGMGTAVRIDLPLA
jgi:signal transduction histidine kinase